LGGWHVKIDLKYVADKVAGKRRQSKAGREEKKEDEFRNIEQTVEESYKIKRNEPEDGNREWLWDAIECLKDEIWMLPTSEEEQLVNVIPVYCDRELWLYIHTLQ
jgi:hypothetical protein